METGKKNAQTNQVFFLIECIVYSLCLIAFLILGIGNTVTARTANIIYCAFILISFGYLFALEFVFRKYDNAVHGKMFAKYYVPSSKSAAPPKRRGLAAVLVLWLLYLLFLVILRSTGVLTWYVFLTGACLMFILNSVFVRKKCLLSLLLLHNRNDCCQNCGINGWDLAIFASALFFAPRLSVAATIINLTIIALSALLWILWEISYHSHPERFYPETNRSLGCAHCLKQCRYRENR